MSLPSVAIIRDKDGNEIARPFINCGWFIDSASLAYTFMYGIHERNDKVEELKPLVDTDTVEAYGEKLTVGFLRSMKDLQQLENYFELKWAAQKVIKQQLKEQNDSPNAN